MPLYLYQILLVFEITISPELEKLTLLLIKLTARFDKLVNHMPTIRSAAALSEGLGSYKHREIIKLDRMVIKLMQMS